MQLNRLFLIIGLCAASVRSAPQTFDQRTSFVLTPRAGTLEWNTPRDDGGAFLAKRADEHSEEWFNSRRSVRRRDDDGYTASKRATADNWQDLTGANSMVSFPTGVSWGGKRQDVFYHDQDGNVCTHYFYDGSKWNAEENLGGSFDSSFGASCWGSGRIDTYGKGTDGACWHNSYDSSSGWSSWTSLGGNMAHEPSTVSWGTGRSDVFVTSANDGQCWHRAYSSGGWGSWESIGGTIDQAPESCSWGTGHMSVFAKGTDGQCWHRMWLSSKGGWSSWEALGGTLTGPVSSVAWGGNRMDLFVRGTDNHCWHRRYHGDLNQWDSWEDLGGNLAYAPKVVQYESTLEVYIVESDKTMYRRVSTSNVWTSSWQSFGGSLASQPSGVVWNTNSVDVYAMGTDYSCERSF